MTAHIEGRTQCPHCHTTKTVVLGHFEDGVMTLEKTTSANDPATYYPLPENERVLEVFCTGCGTMFHPNSI